MIKTNCNAILFRGTLGKDLEVKQGSNGGKSFGSVSCAQTTSWPNERTSWPNQRTTWMNLKFNDSMLQKVQRNGGLFKGDEIVVEGYLVQRKGSNNSTITEIQVQNIVSHLPKVLRDLAKQSGINNHSQPVQPQQQNVQPQQFAQPVQPQQPQQEQQYAQLQQFAQPVQPQQQHALPDQNQPQQPQYAQLDHNQLQYAQPVQNVQQQPQQYAQPVQNVQQQPQQ
ncbi:single-stranded DNA-binding protein, partial [Photobacterium damselae subsp. damselae]|nr:single-stranded DNA-binding protein [Photobacterium damselae subsp. damselae]